MVSREIVNPVKLLKKSVGDLDAEATARLISATSDIALIVDREGIVRDVTAGSDELSAEGCAAWVGKAFQETVTIESRIKVEELLREAASNGVPRWRHINHPSSKGQGDIPVRYAAVPLGERGRSLVIGRDLRAMATLQQRLVTTQQAMEREYAKLRQAETRYRLLFQMASEAILVVDAVNEKVTEANPAAEAAFGIPLKKLIGRNVVELFESGGDGDMQSLLSSVRSAGRTDELNVKLAASGSQFSLSASLFRQDNGSHFLIRLSTSAAGNSHPRTGQAKSKLIEVIDQLPDGFVVTGLDKRILTANAAFLELAQLGSEDQARGESLDEWLGRSSVDMNVLSSNLREHGVVRNFATILRGALGSTEDVEISAVSVTAGEQPCLGFTVRSVGRRINQEVRSDRHLPRSVQQLTELVGRVPLKDLVRDTTDMIEKLCIEAALELAGNNRASAAEMLGLSRQSLYVKLRRFGLGDLGTESEH